MSKYFNVIKATASDGSAIAIECSQRSMETRVHLSNGVSPKNRKTKGKFNSKLLTDQFISGLRKKQALLFMFFIPVFLFAQKNGKAGIYTIDGNNNWGKGYKVIYYWDELDANELYIQNGSLKYGDIITHVDGVHIYQMDDEEFTNICRGEIGSEVEFTILRMGNSNPIKIKRKRKQDDGVSGEYYFMRYMAERSKRFEKIDDHTIWRTNNSDDRHQVYSDQEVDFWNYKTFDFEYTNQKQPLLEKELAIIIERVLESKGLIRDKENPDILIFINFFSDIKEQYVPPTEQFTTRYKTSYNIWTDRMETKPYLQSHTQGGYTSTEYLTLLEIIFMDAQKVKHGNNKIPPIIWNATSEYMSETKMTILNEAKEEYPLLLKSYPLISWQIDVPYPDWGIYVNYQNPEKITKVKPYGFAERLGLKKGYIVAGIKVDFRGYRAKYSTGCSMGDFLLRGNKGIKFLYRDLKAIAVSRNGKFKHFRGIVEQPPVKRIVMSLPLIEAQ